MALISCRECNGPVSTEAAACPHCEAPPQSAAPPRLSSQLSPIPPKEVAFYSDNAVAVTSARIVVYGTTYPLHNIASVGVSCTSPRMVKPVLLLIIAAIILLFAFMPLNDVKAPIEAYIIPSGMILGSIVWMIMAKARFHVRLTTASGELQVLTSGNRDYIQHVVQSINEAIVSVG